jgi:hypothetical protein
LSSPEVLIRINLRLLKSENPDPEPHLKTGTMNSLVKSKSVLTLDSPRVLCLCKDSRLDL